MVQKDNLKKSIIICGPTASGKTALSVLLAKKLNTDVVSADSLYIYKGLDIGTAKPTKEEMQGVTHHLIDVCSPFDNFSVSDYESLASKVVDDLLLSDKTPIICGGTGFYINSLIFDLSYGKVAENPDIRQKYNDLALEKGNGAVHDVLKKIDPKSAEDIHQNNLKRVIRAIEIYEVSGKRKSEIDDGNNVKRDYLAYTINFDREVLYNRIEKRVDIMLKDGLIEEVEGLIKLGLDKNSQCMQGIGYKEVLEYLDGEIDYNSLREKLILNTRHYAKRQETFFKRMPNLKYLKPDEPNKLIDIILNDLNI
jgi:tRNA dimethylallyltransferase